MADPNDANNAQQPQQRPAQDLPGEESDVPVESEPLDLDAPRRAASAEFEVESRLGAHAALRDAMDPANQSLGEALRLSFRVLQVVILVLVVLFLASGFKTVENDQIGVLTVWGKITPVGGEEELSPGLRFSVWPYPAGQFVLRKVENRSVELTDAFWPKVPEGVTEEELIEKARSSGQIKPGIDGSVLTLDGDLAHLRITVQYEIDDVVTFINHVRDAQADELIRLAVERGAVHVVGQTPLRDVVDVSSDVLEERIQTSAQTVLDGLDCGIRLTRVTVTDANPPFSIVRAYREVQAARAEAERLIEAARDEANNMLLGAVGENYRPLVALIEQYENAMNLGDEELGAEINRQIDEFLESEKAGGAVSQIIQRAKAHQAQIESTLGNEARRLASLRDAFRDNPRLVVMQQWLNAYHNVLARQDIEIYRVPADGGDIVLHIRTLDELQELRRRQRLDSKEQESRQSFWGAQRSYIPTLRDRETSNRRLQVEEGQIQLRDRSQ